jgi:diguanylate cyclase (GGDEF)-like protein
MPPFFNFSSRKTPDRDLPLPVYQALVASLHKGLQSNLGGIYANFLLAGYILATHQSLALKLAALPLIAANILRLGDLLLYARGARDGSRKPPNTIREVDAVEQRYLFISAIFALALGLLCVISIKTPIDENLRLIIFADSIVTIMVSGGRACGSPRVVLAQYVCALGPFAIAEIATGESGNGLLATLVLLSGKVLHDSTRHMHDTLVSMLMTSRQFKEKAAEFDSALNNMGRGLVLFDRHHVVKVANELFRAIFNLDDEPCGLSNEMLFHRAIAPLVGRSDTISETMAFFEGKRGSFRDLTLADGRILSLTHEPMHHGSVITVDDVTDQRSAESTMRRLARYDIVTGLPNRFSFCEIIAKAIKTSSGDDAFSLLSIDLDRFKEVNDNYGHPAGDRILGMVADRMRNIIGPNGETARFGGDEFMAIVATADQTQIARIAASLIRAISQPYDLDGAQIVIGASVGVAVYPTDAESRESRIRASDMALYDAKASGRGVYKFFVEDMAVAVRKRRQLAEALRTAASNGEMSLAFQPIINLPHMRTTSVEALVRWNNPKFGQISPVDFISIAEETGVIVEIGAFVLERACKAALSWPSNVRVAVNLSAIQFDRGDLIETVTTALRETGLPPERLELEVTESILIGNSSAAIAKLSALRALGIHIALDDFGTGYSSFSYLNDFEFDKIKIDQSFVRDINNPNTSKATSIIRAVNAIARDFQMTIVVEGVETEDQLVALRRLGVSHAQGYLFSKPMSAEDMGISLLREFSPVGALTIIDVAPGRLKSGAA